MHSHLIFKFPFQDCFTYLLVCVRVLHWLISFGFYAQGAAEA